MLFLDKVYLLPLVLVEEQVALELQFQQLAEQPLRVKLQEPQELEQYQLLFVGHLLHQVALASLQAWHQMVIQRMVVAEQELAHFMEQAEMAVQVSQILVLAVEEVVWVLLLLEPAVAVVLVVPAEPPEVVVPPEKLLITQEVQVLVF
jgi:hypothetical protein